MAALLDSQLNFILTCPSQAKDKIRLLLQKLEDLSFHFSCPVNLAF
jgi:hypothetical protein